MLQDKALATKRPEIRDGWLASKAKLKGGQIQDLVQENSIGDITCSADSIGPKMSRSLILIEHHPCRVNESVVLSFHNSILLRHIWGRKLLINTTLKAKLIKRGILELGLIVTVNSFQAVGILIVQPQSQALKVFKHFILAFQEENPRATRIVINNDKNIPLDVTPSFKAKTKCIPLCVPGSRFTHKVTNSEINSITSVYYIKSYYKILLQDQEV
jgi:hypothetical protein